MKKIVVLITLAGCIKSSEDVAHSVVGQTGKCLRSQGKYSDVTFCFLPDKSLLICTQDACITNASELPAPPLPPTP